MILSARMAVFRSVSTQYCKSSMNSGWKTASRFVAKSHLGTKFAQRLWLAFVL